MAMHVDGARVLCWGFVLGLEPPRSLDCGESELELCQLNSWAWSWHPICPARVVVVLDIHFKRGKKRSPNSG